MLRRCFNRNSFTNRQEAHLAFTRGTRGSGDKFQIWQSLDRIANRNMKKKEKEMEPKR